MKAIITDCRFKDEVDWILSNQGIIIHLTRPGADGTVGISQHSSEKLAQEFASIYGMQENIYYVLNDSTRVVLQEKAAQFAAKL